MTVDNKTIETVKKILHDYIRKLEVDDYDPNAITKMIEINAVLEKLQEDQ